MMQRERDPDLRVEVGGPPPEISVLARATRRARSEAGAIGTDRNARRLVGTFVMGCTHEDARRAAANRGASCNADAAPHVCMKTRAATFFTQSL
jgi:hypothetical protein